MPFSVSQLHVSFAAFCDCNLSNLEPRLPTKLILQERLLLSRCLRPSCPACLQRNAAVSDPHQRSLQGWQQQQYGLPEDAVARGIFMLFSARHLHVVQSPGLHRQLQSIGTFYLSMTLWGPSSILTFAPSRIGSDTSAWQRSLSQSSVGKRLFQVLMLPMTVICWKMPQSASVKGLARLFHREDRSVWLQKQAAVSHESWSLQARPVCPPTGEDCCSIQLVHTGYSQALEALNNVSNNCMSWQAMTLGSSYGGVLARALTIAGFANCLHRTSRSTVAILCLSPMI